MGGNQSKPSKTRGTERAKSNDSKASAANTPEKSTDAPNMEQMEQQMSDTFARLERLEVENMQLSNRLSKLAASTPARAEVSYHVDKVGATKDTTDHTDE